MSRPNRRTRPEVSGISPLMRRKSVVLPAPFGPMMPRRSPSATVRLAPRTASSPPNRRVTSSHSRAAVGAVAGIGSAPDDAEHAEQPPRRPERGHHVDGGQHHDPALGEDADHLLEERHDEGADDGTDERAGPADDH